MIIANILDGFPTSFFILIPYNDTGIVEIIPHITDATVYVKIKLKLNEVIICKLIIPIVIAGKSNNIHIRNSHHFFV